MRLHGRRRQCPFHGRKRQSPEGRVGFTWSCRCHHARGSAQRGGSDILIGNLTSKFNSIMTSHVVENPLWSRTYHLLFEPLPDAPPRPHRWRAGGRERVSGRPHVAGTTGRSCTDTLT